MKLKSILARQHDNMRTILSVILMGASTLGFAQTDMTNLITNPSFENGTTGWTGSPTLGGVNSGNIVNQCAEKWNTNFVISQTITGLADGYYQITAKGFYRDGGYSNAASAHTAGTESLHAMLFANNNAVRLGSICNEADIARISGMTSYGNWSSTSLGSVPNSMESAAAAFTIDAAYNNKVYVKVTDGTLRFGVRVTEAFNSESWAIFDDFHLYYYGDTEPTASGTIEELPERISGQFVIYNIDTQKFLVAPTANDGRLRLSANITTDEYYVFDIEDYNGVVYTIQPSGTGRNLSCWNRAPAIDRGSTSNYIGFTITKLPDGAYTITNDHYPSNYLGIGDSEVYVYADKTTENINWQLIDISTSTDETGAFHTALETTLGGADTELFSEYYAVLNNENSTIKELYDANKNASTALAMTSYVKDAWGGEYFIMFEENPTNASAWEWTDNNLFRRNYNMTSGQTQTLVGTVIVDQEAVLRYNPYNANSQCNERDYYSSSSNNYYWRNYSTERYATMEVYIDDKLVRTINRQELGRDWWFYETLSKGKHVIKWVGICPEGYSDQYIDLQWISVNKMPTVTVNVVEAGELGLEVLQSTDSNGDKVSRIQDVRKLVIKGNLNADDWAQIDNMPNLYSLDISETTVTNIPDNMFNRDTDNGGKSSKQYLYELKLPKGVESIGYRAFRYSYIDEIEFPSTLKTVGDEAFHNAYIDKVILSNGVTSIGKDAFSYCFSLNEISLPEALTSIGDYAFSHCYNLEKANLPSSLTIIPQYCFNNCHALKDLTLHEGITEIRNDAFVRTWNYNPTLPTTLRSIGERAFFDSRITNPVFSDSVSIGHYAFKYCPITTLDLPEEAKFGNLCFADCKQLTSISFPSSYYLATNDSPILRYDNALTDVTLKSSTVVLGDYKDRFFWDCGSNFTVRVPDYLLNLYKQDSYWKDYTLEAFGTDEVEQWYVRNPLVMSHYDSFKGSPNVTVQYETGTLHIKSGGSAMSINNLYVDWSSQVMSEREGVTILGDYTHCYYTRDDVWYFVSLPFNFRPSEVTSQYGSHIALRYYDGAHRAANGPSGSWKDLPADTIVSAGSGFIIRSSKADYVWFHALNDGDKQNIFSTSEFVKSLEVNDSENASDKGWNLVGNPYQTYYNMHKLGTIAPYTVYEHTTSYFNSRNGWGTWANGGIYKARSIVDDDYALLPNGAYFIQCPDEKSQVTYPVAGKQLTSEITDQTGTKARLQSADIRKLIDLTLSFGDLKDETRVVFNPEASVAYETTCDASKFMAEDKTMPQMYTIGADNTHYAINERPALTDASVPLGLFIPEKGQYSIGVNRNRGAGTILLHDRELDNYIDITDNVYTFYSDAGTIESRFELVAANQATGIDQIGDNQPTLMGGQPIYNINGQRLGSLQKGINVIGGKKVIVK